MSDVTRLLHAVGQGDPQGLAKKLLPLVYDELGQVDGQGTVDVSGERVAFEVEFRVGRK
jgi:hypothetical protein